MRFALVFALAFSLFESVVLASPTSTQPEKRFAAASPGTCSFTCPTGPGTFTNSIDYYPSGQADMTVCYYENVPDTSPAGDRVECKYKSTTGELLLGIDHDTVTPYNNCPPADKHGLCDGVTYAKRSLFKQPLSALQQRIRARQWSSKKLLARSAAKRQP